MNKEKKVSLLIPTMNRPESLKRTLSTYFQSICIPEQVIVVDQSSSAELRDKCRECVDSFKNIVDIEYLFQETPSLTKARNTAFSYARNEIIVCSDDDVDVEKDTIKNVIELMSDDGYAMIAGIDKNSAISKSNTGFLLGTKSFCKRKIGHVTKSMLGRYPDNVVGEVNTEWAMGYFFVVRKSLVEKWQIQWDEKLTSFAYAEDLDFSYRYYLNAKKESYKCVLNSLVQVTHLASREYRIPSRKSTFMFVVHREYLAAKLNVAKKHYFSRRWCDFWKLVERIVKKQNPQDMKDAIRYLQKNLSDVREGRFPF